MIISCDFRAYVAAQNGIPIDKEAERIHQENCQDYIKKLKADGQVFPDPYSLTSSWLPESTAKEWPKLTIAEISAHFQSTAVDVTPLGHRLLNEYKESKAYR